MQGNELRKYYGLKFVTSSLEKKAAVAAIKEKLDQDSTRVPVAVPENTESKSLTVESSEQKRPIRLSVVSEIAASAACYVRSRANGLLSPGSKSHEEEEGGTGTLMDSCRSGDQPEVGGENSPPRVYNSEVAAYMAASTMTAVVRAGEKEKQETAKDLQSLHSSPCEWFICDDLSTYTRCFVIQVAVQFLVSYFYIYICIYDLIGLTLQGSDSLASWQANLFFEPTKFEVI